MMKTTYNSRKGFTLIEMIGVLAIIGILAAVVAPRVIESIRDAKVTSAISSVNAAKTAALNYYQRYDRFVLDSQFPTTFANNKNDIAESSIDPNFGSLLFYQEQLLESIRTPIGEATSTPSEEGSPSTGKDWAIGCVTAADGEMSAGGGNLKYTGRVQFKSAGNASRIVYYYFPNLTTQEAAALATKINGPFPVSLQGEASIIKAFTTEVEDFPEGIEGANCWFTSSGNLHDAYIYVAHQ